jgi:hypothetical protein
MRADRNVLRHRLGALLDGRLEEVEFMGWLTQIETGETEIPPGEAPLVARLINLFEDDSIDEEARRGLACSYLACLESELSTDEIADVFPLVLSKEKLCIVADKWKLGLLNRTHFTAYVRNSHLGAEQKDWLIEATPEAVSYLCQMLASGDYEETVRLLRM